VVIEAVGVIEPKRRNGMASVLMQRKEVQEMFGIGKRAFYNLIDAGVIHRTWLDYDEHGNGVGRPYYLREKMEFLKRELVEKGAI
jgi:hypothetical protein